MALIEEYYELNEAEEVSVVWKIAHIGFYGGAGIFGICCGFTLANLRARFDDRCYLFTEVKAPGKDERIDQSNINWGSDPWCDYYQFSMVSSFIVGIIWGTLYLMCGNGGKSATGLPQPWRIVWPSLVFNLIYFVITLCTAIFIQRGTDFFCARHLDQRLHTKTLMESCEPLKLLLPEKDVYMVLLQLEISVKTSWGCVLCWFVLSVLPLFRIILVVDFNLYKICVFKIDDTNQNKKEEILRITNYEEPKRLLFETDDDAKISEEKDIFEDVEAGSGRKTKPEKKSLRQHFNISNRSLYIPNAIFYETTDLRMLNREKKRKKSFNEAFGRSRTNLAPELRRSLKARPGSDVSGSSDVPALLFRSSKRPYADEDDACDPSSLPSPQKPRFDDDWNEGGSGGETPLDPNRLLRFKKRI